ncbi:MAG: sulfite exporter TauE/SafE family protein [Gemmatimonas sp.]
MQLYLPIAEMSVDIFVLLLLGGGIGFLSGLFGVGGGFLLTPLLIFVGVPPAVAVATQANQVIAASVTGAISHWRRGNVDVRMGIVLLAGGFVGSSLGVALYTALRAVGQLDLVIALSYVFFLGTVGALMLQESLRAILRKWRADTLLRRKLHVHTWVHGLPLKMRFRTSKLYISALLPFVIGAVVGVLSAILGTGGGFLMLPAMIYLLGMPTVLAVGTSLFQIVFVAANVTLLQAIHNQTVDVFLAFVLIVGGVIGAPLGSRLAGRLPGEQLRALLALIVFAVSVKLLIDLVRTPADVYILLPPVS